MSEGVKKYINLSYTIFSVSYIILALCMKICTCNSQVTDRKPPYTTYQTHQELDPNVQVCSKHIYVQYIIQKTNLYIMCMQHTHGTQLHVNNSKSHKIKIESHIKYKSCTEKPILQQIMQCWRSISKGGYLYQEIINVQPLLHSQFPCFKLFTSPPKMAQRCFVNTFSYNARYVKNNQKLQ
jgi:hypothetical protein